MVIGKDQASCTYACPYCECKSPWLCTCKLNTLGSLRAWYDKWVEDGADPKRRKLFQNVSNIPLIKGEDGQLILTLFVPMELHLLLGITEKLLFEFKRNVFSSKSAGKKFMKKFYKEQNITVNGKRGGKLNGKACRDLLDSVDQLELALQARSEDVHLRGLPFINALRKFNTVRLKTFKMDLEEGWEEAIRVFETSYRELRNKDDKPISVTPKVNLLSVIYIFLAVIVAAL